LFAYERTIEQDRTYEPATAKQNSGWGDDWAEIERNASAEFVHTALQRFGRPEEIAAAVVFLSSPLASYIHGANLRVDGGYGVAVN
jgi:NAD(P)-dependent dehydrogenase (short-subunit alcohol dehydrogenase family)